VRPTEQWPVSLYLLPARISARPQLSSRDVILMSDTFSMPTICIPCNCAFPWISRKYMSISRGFSWYVHTKRSHGLDLRAKEALFQRYHAHLNTAATSLCLQASVFVRKGAMKYSSLRLLYWLHGSSSVSVRVTQLDIPAPPRTCRIFIVGRLMTQQRPPIFHGRFAKIQYRDVYYVYFLSLRPAYLSCSLGGNCCFYCCENFSEMFLQIVKQERDSTATPQANVVLLHLRCLLRISCIYIYCMVYIPYIYYIYIYIYIYNVFRKHTWILLWTGYISHPIRKL